MKIKKIISVLLVWILASSSIIQVFADDPIVDSGATTGSGVTDSGATLPDSGTGLTDSGTTDSGSTNTGTTDSGSTSSGTITDTGSTNTGTTGGTSSSSSTPKSPKTSYYIYLGDEKVATVENQSGTTKTIFHLNDNQGGSNIDTDSSGEVLQITDYMPFGKERLVQQNTDYKNKYGFIGKEKDNESNLNYVEARYYDSNIGRFISQDNIFWELGQTGRGIKYLFDPQLLNSYSYGRNNPVNFSDPSGEEITFDGVMSVIFGYSYCGGDDHGSVDRINQLQQNSSDSIYVGFGVAIIAGGTAGAIKSAVTGAVKGAVVTGEKEIMKTAVKQAEVVGINAVKKEAIAIMKRSMMDTVKSGKLTKMADFKDIAKNGGQEVLKTIKRSLDDPKYSSGWIKRSYQQFTQAGGNVEIHFMQNIKTGAIEQIKFK